MRTTRAGPATPLVMDRLRPARNTCPSWARVWNDRLGGADLGKLPEQWRWESHQSGTIPEWWTGLCALAHDSFLGRRTYELPPRSFGGGGGFDLFFDMSEVFLLKLTQLSVSGLETSQWSHVIHTFTLQEFYHVSWAKREKNSTNAGTRPPVLPNERLPRSGYSCA